MNSKTSVTAKQFLDHIKLASAVILIVLGITAFYYFETYSALLRVIGLLAIGAIAVTLTYQTNIGQQIWQFFLDSRMEVRKVVWPTQEETLQTTLIVFVMVLIMGILLWLFDMMLVAIVRYLTGQGS
ncbi:preprotein translocase subunit SecE [Achromatium sp. WMS3]|nr:preprotein translocase subunit SecE [Achromatium sp. WMS3]